MVTLSSIKARSVLGDNYRYLYHNYSINFNAINGCINHLIPQFVDCPQYAYTVRYLCYFRDWADPFVLISTEIVQLIEYLCTIGDIISYLYYKPVYYCVLSCAEMTCIIALLCMII